MSVALTLEKFHDGEMVGRYALDGARKRLYRLGRLPRADVQVFDTNADRVHAVIDLSERRPIIRDMGSKAGTFINGRKISRATLKTDDEIVIGDTRLKVTLANSPLLPPPIPKAADRPKEVLIDKVATLTPHSAGQLAIYADFLRGKRKQRPHQQRVDAPVRPAQDANPDQISPSLELVEPDRCLDDDADDTVVDLPRPTGAPEPIAELPYGPEQPRTYGRLLGLIAATLAGAAIAAAMVVPEVNDEARRWYDIATAALSVDTAPPEPTPAQQRSYTVRAGDTLGLIAKRELGSATRWRELYARNSEILADPSDLGIGLELRLPTER